MNEMNELEMQLRMWAPRRPSPRLKEKLFADAAASSRDHLAPSTQHPSLGFRLSWLAPAAVALVAMCLIFNQRNSPAVAGSTNSGPLVAMMMSNQSAAAYLPGSFQRNQNRLDTFEWTNRSGSTSSIGSLSPLRGIK